MQTGDRCNRANLADGVGLVLKGFDVAPKML